MEDDVGDARIVRDLLETADAGLRLVWVRSLGDARRRLTADTVCIILDLSLPDTVMSDGLRRVIDMAGPVPVVVLTGLANRALGSAAVAEGAQDYLVKGVVDGEGLARAVRYAIERKRGQEIARRLHEADLLAAEKARLERGLLPQPVLSNPALRWVTRYRPGGGRALLGGDFFDGIELGASGGMGSPRSEGIRGPGRAEDAEGGSIRVVVGDVTGHGPDEAALGAALRVAWRALVMADSDGETTLRHLDQILRLERLHDDVFATICDLELRPDLAGGTLRLGGHPSPLLVRDTTVQEVHAVERGPLLGLLDQAEWPAQPLDLGREWALILFTDGIIEGRTASGGRLNVDGLSRLATAAVIRGCGLAELADELLAGAEAANDGPLADDVAIFLLATGDRWS